MKLHGTPEEQLQLKLIRRLGSNLRKHRYEKALRIEKVAQEAGIDPLLYANFETGFITAQECEELAPKIIAALGINPMIYAPILRHIKGEES
jgi:transcriptional regulator with XRE-family HTH domain